ncbi:uncharacterized protein LOC141587129 [Silene latifolia]|uniref:uncharacterized protein LOC141587129 n=1 Tax=Silene latifolia TaxID=37657 RepID=UPI003D774BF5
MEVDTTISKEQPQTPPPQNTDAHSLSVKVETLVSVSEQSNEVLNTLQVIVPSIQNNKDSSLETRYFKIFMFFFYLLCFLLAIVCLVPVVLLVYVCVTVVTIAALPFFLVQLVVLRLLEFFVEPNNFGKVTKNKAHVTVWLFMYLILLFFEVALFYPFAKHVPELKVVMIIDLPVTLLASGSWIYKYKSDLINTEATSEIFSCLLFWWAEVEWYKEKHHIHPNHGDALTYLGVVFWASPKHNISGYENYAIWYSDSDIGKLLYFLLLLSYTHFQSVVEKPVTKQSKIALLAKHCEGGIPWKLNRKRGREELINRTGPNASAYELWEAAQDFLAAQYALLKEGIFEDLHHLQSNISGENTANIVEILEKIVRCGEYAEDDWNMFSELLSTVDSTDEITFQKVKIWMERSHSRCKFLANTLQSEKEAAKCLNRILSGLIIAATVLTWLFLTGLATTQVIVLISSPLLAATFVFGDTAKGLFQGLIFVYVVRPFNVGDLCVIDEKLLEVKKIGVWCTTFSKVRTVSTQQEIIYPNSELATKNVINHKTGFDWTDYIELSPSSTDEEATKNLKHQIETYLDTEKERFTPNFHSVEILEIGDKDKIAVHFRHNVQDEGWIYFECLKEKEKRKSEFALYLRNLLNQQELKTKTPS